jgi:hypothetical protein
LKEIGKVNYAKANIQVDFRYPMGCIVRAIYDKRKTNGANGTFEWHPGTVTRWNLHWGEEVPTYYITFDDNDINECVPENEIELYNRSDPGASRYTTSIL